VAVSRRVDKSAVVRNRLRRQLKEYFRLHRSGLPVGDYVFIAKPDAANADNNAIRKDLSTIFERTRALKPVAAPGTMPSFLANNDRSPTDT